MSVPSSRRFRFGRSTEEARAGETLLEALARRGWPSLVRSVRYHRPRGPVCGTGVCAGCLVRVNGRPNVRACRYRVEDGDRVRTENAWPGPRFDLLGVLDLVLPRGIDTVHGFRRPAWATRLYQKVVRRLAGYGAVPDPAVARARPGTRTWSVETVVIGAGAAGRAVAAELAQRGRRPLVLERERPRASPGIEGADLVEGTTATFLAPPEAGSATGFTVLGFDDEGRGIRVRASSVVVASGGYDAGLLFEGSDRPGIVTGDLVLAGLGLPFGPTVVVGGGPRARKVVERLGEEVRAVVGFDAIDPEVAGAAAELGVPLYPRTRVVRAIGRRRIRAVELARRDGTGRFRLPCASVVLAHRRLPNAQLLFQAGVPRVWRDPPGAYYPDLEPAGRTPVEGLFAAGSAASPRGGADLDPRDVATAVLGAPPRPAAPGPVERTRGELLAYYRELLREPRRDKWVLCPCEDVLLDEVEAAHARGYRGLEVIKRYTSAGTGLCQGRFCLPEAILVLALLEGRTPPEVGFITQRPPLVPTALGALAELAEAAPPEAGS